MAVREKNVARRSVSVKGYATDCGGIFTATTEHLCSHFPGSEPEAPVVKLPMAGFPKSWPGGGLDGADVGGSFGFGYSTDVGLAEHLKPVDETELDVKHDRPGLLSMANAG